jgi:hypothetical protein
MSISVRKPKVKSDINAEEALHFAAVDTSIKAGKPIASQSKVVQKSIQEFDSKSGLVPEGDVRLTANIRADLHMKLKMKAVQDRTTIGELIEVLIEDHL